MTALPEGGEGRADSGCERRHPIIQFPNTAAAVQRPVVRKNGDCAARQARRAPRHAAPHFFEGTGEARSAASEFDAAAAVPSVSRNLEDTPLRDVLPACGVLAGGVRLLDRRARAAPRRPRRTQTTIDGRRRRCRAAAARVVAEQAADQIPFRGGAGSVDDAGIE